MKVLVVDDMTVMRKIISKAVAPIEGIEIMTAENGQEAWDLLEKEHGEGSAFEFIISDWNMPEVTGYDLLIKVRKDERFKKLPFLMVTAEGEKGNVALALKAGVSNFIVKPFKADILQEKVKKLMAA